MRIMRAKLVIRSAVAFAGACWLVAGPAAIDARQTTKAPSSTSGTKASASTSGTSGTAVATARIPQSVMANGEVLSAGTYTVRLSDDSVTPVVGESDGAEHWVEFLQNGQVKGKELASVASGPDAKAVLKGPAPPSGTARVQTLKGADYLRVWVNKGGTNYLVHLPFAKKGTA